jgi:hypothetical protein
VIDFQAIDDADRAIRARVDLVGDRIADLLAPGRPIDVHAAELVDLRTGEHARSGSGVIDPARLAIVVGTGPRGAANRRVETRYRAVMIGVGRFTVHGFLHAPVTVDPVQHAFERAWLPVTEAVLEYQVPGRLCRERFDTLLVNRAAVKTITVIGEAAHEVQWLASSPSRVFPRELLGV